MDKDIQQLIGNLQDQIVIFNNHNHDGLNSQRMNNEVNNHWLPSIGADYLHSVSGYNLGSPIRKWNKLYLAGEIIAVDSEVDVSSVFADYLESSDAITATNLLECGSFRINQTPTSGTLTPNKYITINCNGTAYKIPVKQ